MTVYIEIAALLIDIEGELRSLNLWQSEPPSPQALASTEPFCIDTLSSVQWLQFIFLPRLRALLQAQRLPPGRCEIQPLAEQYFADSRLAVQPLIALLGRLDRLLNDAR
jgi:uncharacterized protein YqcC (DUF446 family)